MASMPISLRLHRAYMARLWRFHGVSFILPRFCGRVCKAFSRRSWRSRGASTAFTRRFLGVHCASVDLQPRPMEFSDKITK